MDYGVYLNLAGTHKTLFWRTPFPPELKKPALNQRVFLRLRLALTLYKTTWYALFHGVLYSIYATGIQSVFMLNSIFYGLHDGLQKLSHAEANS